MVESRTRFRRYQLRDKTLEWGTEGWACFMKFWVPPHTLVYSVCYNKSSLFIIFFWLAVFINLCLSGESVIVCFHAQTNVLCAWGVFPIRPNATALRGVNTSKN